MPDSEVVRNLRTFRVRLLAREDAQLERLMRGWLRIERSLADKMELLAFQILEAQRSGDIITEQLVRRMTRYQELQSQMKERILSFADGEAAADIAREQRIFAALGLEAAQGVIADNFLGVAVPSFNRLPVEAFESMFGMLGNGSPLNTLLREAYPDALDGVITGLLDGVARGFGPVQVAREMAHGMGLGLERITLIARTEQLRMWRMSSTQQYRDSGLSGVQKRLAAKDSEVCMACLLLDGEVIPLDEEVDDHPRGRCTSIFVVDGAQPVEWEKGKDWFENQPESVQRDMMGPNAFEAWKGGQIQLTDLITHSHSDIWGSAPQVASLKSLGIRTSLGGMSARTTREIVSSSLPPATDVVARQELAKEVAESLGFHPNGITFEERDQIVHGGKLLGAWDPELGRIFMFPAGMAKDDFLETMVHEVAHQRINMKLGALKIQFKNLMGVPATAKEIRKMGPISEYATFVLRKIGDTDITTVLDEAWAELNRLDMIGKLDTVSPNWRAWYAKVTERANARI